MSTPFGDRATASAGTTPQIRRVRQSVSVSWLLHRGWMLLVGVVVVAVAGLTIHRLHGAFPDQHRPQASADAVDDTEPFNPKQMVLEVFGTSGSVATINYLDGDAQPHQVVNATLPWSYTITTAEPAIMGNLVAQGDGDRIGCRISVNGTVKDERTITTMNAYTFCLDKSG